MIGLIDWTLPQCYTANHIEWVPAASAFTERQWKSRPSPDEEMLAFETMAALQCNPRSWTKITCPRCFPLHGEVCASVQGSNPDTAVGQTYPVPFIDVQDRCWRSVGAYVVFLNGSRQMRISFSSHSQKKCSCSNKKSLKRYTAGCSHPQAMELEGATVSVHYKDRMSEIKLNLAGNVDVAYRDQEVVSLALNLQAALNLATPPIGLRLRVAPGTEAVVCPLSVLVACPSYIATTFQGECACGEHGCHVLCVSSR